MSETKLSNVRSFIILPSREGLTSFNKDNSANFSDVKKSRKMKLKNSETNLVLVVVLIRESKGL